MDELKARGEKVYASNCAVCHQPTGKGAGAFPALDGSKIANGPIAEHVNIVLNGKNAMPPWAHDAERRRNRVGHHVRTQFVGQPDRRHSPAEAGRRCPQRQDAGRRRSSGRRGCGGEAVAAAERRLRGCRRRAASAHAAAAAPASAARRPRKRGSLPASIYFETGKSTLPADATAAVEAAAAYAKAHPDAKFALSGFTDATGSADKNAEAREESRASRARRAEGSGHRRRPHRFEEAGNDYGRRGCERSPSRRDQSGCLTCRACSGKGGRCTKCRSIRFRRLSCLASDTM